MLDNVTISKLTNKVFELILQMWLNILIIKIENKMSDTLLLNANYQPISVLPLSTIGWQHAIKLMYLDSITVLETYENWVVRSARLAIHVPCVAVTRDYFDIKKGAKFSRRNLFLRDMFQCQYCGDTFEPHELTLDHYIPRSMGGKTTWENSLTACRTCNHKKGASLWKPLRLPYKPDYYHLVNKWKSTRVRVRHPAWLKYLNLKEGENVSVDPFANYQAMDKEVK